MKTSIISILFLMVLGILSRLIPHPWNFTALGSASLFAGALMLRSDLPLPKWARGILSLLVPMTILFLSDLALGFYEGMMATYLASLVVVALGWIWASNLSEGGLKKAALVQGAGFMLLGSTIFFLMSNFAVWHLSGMYAKSLSGLLTCYALALPFFHWQILGDLVYFSVCVFALSYSNHKIFAYQKSS